MCFRAFSSQFSILLLFSLIGVRFVCVSAAPPGISAKGKQIYFKLCVECHGRNGEGVKGKYSHPLQGNWTVEKLANVIDRTMPEDQPHLCKGEDARAVARFVFDAFYSRDARARNRPPRIELARLTNPQYLNAVADLLKQFGSPEGVIPSERGLKANYYNSRGFASDKKLVERIDPGIHFEYGQDSPIPDKIGKEEYSIQWRGSLMTDETGDHEFVLRTPNGARLWINNEEEPVIDAWVASGSKSEHRAVVRLIGGRAYPVSVDFHKFKDKSASISLEWIPPHGALEPIPQRNLTPKRVPSTFVVKTTFPADDSSVGYERGVAVTKQWDECTTKAALEVAHHVSRNIHRILKLDAGAPIPREKLESFANEFVTTAFRRPLTAEERKSIVSRHLGATPRLEEAIQRVVLHALKSPEFLYLGLTAPADASHERAERLSFAFWDSIPDRKLQTVARDGKLATLDGVRNEARRMIDDPRTRSKLRQFFHHWLQVDHLEGLSKDNAVFPDFGPHVIADLRTSLNLFLDDVVWSTKSDYREMLLSGDVFMNERLARFYKVDAVVTNDFVRVSWEPGKRHGILTHPYLLSAFAYSRTTSPVHRGVFITRNIVGRALKPPPMAIAFKDADFAPDMTMREKVSQVTRAENCQSCHSVINPLGFSLENFDSVGRLRTHENNKPVDTSSDYVTDEGEVVHLSGARDIADFAIRDEQAQSGFIEQLFHHVVKQPMLAYGPDIMPRLRESFIKSGFSIRGLLLEIAEISVMANNTPQTRASQKKL